MNTLDFNSIKAFRLEKKIFPTISNENRIRTRKSFKTFLRIFFGCSFRRIIYNFSKLFGSGVTRN